MATITIDGKKITVDETATIFNSAKQNEIFIPHYCYHPGLSVAGNCRLCMVEIKGISKPQISCATQVKDGMEIFTKSEMIVKARISVLEFLLLNHPIDCPICDQAGECKLQDFYMDYGLHSNRFRLEDKIKKRKAIDIGKNIVLDTERCILCSRCVRFCREISKTNEIGIFDRNVHSEIGTFNKTKIDNLYSGNLVDICPVGAFTDKNFRFQCRAWFLKKANSICPNCSRGCSIEVHYTYDMRCTKDKKRIYRIKPRFNETINKWWICDIGRYGFDFVDSDTRILYPEAREGVGRSFMAKIEWDDALIKIKDEFKKIINEYGKDSIGVLLSAQLSNEDLEKANELFVKELGIKNIASIGRYDGLKDDFLIMEDKNPNSNGIKNLGLNKIPIDEMLKMINSDKIKCLYIAESNFQDKFSEKDVKVFSNLKLFIYQGTNKNFISEYANYLLPASTWVEYSGTFTNFEGKIQKFDEVLEPLAESKPHSQIFNDFINK